MALHADFAAALTVSGDLLRQFVHAAYIADVIPVHVRDTQKVPSFDGVPAYSITYDLFITEPALALKPTPDSPDDAVLVTLRAVGQLMFSAPSLPVLRSNVVIDATINMPVITAKNETSKAIQIGLDVRNVKVVAIKVRLTSGSDPEATYGIGLDGDGLKDFLQKALVIAKPILLTPPVLGPVVALGYELQPPAVLVTPDALNVGIDIVGLTAGNYKSLVDLNRTPAEHGWKKILRQFIHTEDDEYGKPYYEEGWAPTIRNKSGPHSTNLAVVINPSVMNDMFARKGRYEFLRLFEKAKADAVSKSIDSMEARKTIVFELPLIAQVTIHEVQLELQSDGIKLRGKASVASDIAISTWFELKLRPIAIDVDGTTSWVSKHEGVAGFSGEVFYVHIDEPDIVAVVEVINLVLGVVLAPFSFGASLLVALVFEIILREAVSSILWSAERTMGRRAGSALPLEDPHTAFQLPGTLAPTFRIYLNDVVSDSGGVASWIDIVMDESKPSDRPHIYVKSGRHPLAVVFDPGSGLYNVNDTEVRIRWELFADDVRLAHRDTTIAEHALPPFETVDAKLFAHEITTIEGVDIFKVTCRVYRPWGELTQELFKDTLSINYGGRLHSRYRYVSWDHTVAFPGYSAPKGDPDRRRIANFSETRHSKIHYTDPEKRCLFADKYSRFLKPDDLKYSNELPFDVKDILKYQEYICGYCFFGRPRYSILTDPTYTGRGAYA